MKIKELKTKNDAELKTDLQALQEQVRELRFKHSSQELKNPRELTAIRKTIARIQTLLTERANVK